MLLAIALQALVFSPLGVTVNGNRNWIEVAGQQLQPSEGAKVALIVWSAAVLCAQAETLGRWSHVHRAGALPGRRRC